GGGSRGLGAKAAATVIAAATAGAAAVAAAAAVGAWIFAARGYTASRGYVLSLTDPATLRAGAGTVIYFSLVALLAAGIAAAIRGGAAALSAVLALLFAFPLASALVTDATWQRRLHQWSPADAGLNIQVTTGLADLPFRPWTGLAVLAAWAVGAAILGALIFRYRDASGDHPSAPRAVGAPAAVPAWARPRSRLSRAPRSSPRRTVTD